MSKVPYLLVLLGLFLTFTSRSENCPPIRQDHPRIFFNADMLPAIKERAYTEKKEYLEKAKKLLKVSVDAYTEATKNGRPVNWYSHSRVNALCAYDWLYNDLTPEKAN